MHRFFSNKLITSARHLTLTGYVYKAVICLFIIYTFVSCGRIYFPIELETISRSDRSEKQEENEVNVIPMTSKSISLANKTPYQRHIIEAGNLEEPAKFVPAKLALIENFPLRNDPGPYLIGVGDVIGYEELIDRGGSVATSITRQLTVNDDGLINFFQLGRIKALDKTLSELEDLIYKKVVETGGNSNFNLFISRFNSKEIFTS